MTETPEKSRPFRWSDAWLLESIAVASTEAGGRALLAEVLCAADGVNKTPMMDEELNGGVSRLARAGYVAFHDDLSLSLTPAGVALVSEAHAACARERLSAVEALERILGATPWTKDDDPRSAGDDREFFSRAAIQAAEKAYRKALRQALRKRPAP